MPAIKFKNATHTENHDEPQLQELPFTMLDVSLIEADKDNEQLYPADEVADERLRQDISRQGLLQPLLVRRNPRQEFSYILVAGHRRLRALQALGYRRAPCLIMDIQSEADQVLARLSLVATNNQARHRNPGEMLEELQYTIRSLEHIRKISPEAYQKLQDHYQVKTQPELLVKLTGLSRRMFSYYNQILRELSHEDLERLITGQLSMRAAIQKLKEAKLEKKRRQQGQQLSSEGSAAVQQLLSNEFPRMAIRILERYGAWNEKSLSRLLYDCEAVVSAEAFEQLKQATPQQVLDRLNQKDRNEVKE